MSRAVGKQGISSARLDALITKTKERRVGYSAENVVIVEERYTKLHSFVPRLFTPTQSEALNAANLLGLGCVFLETESERMPYVDL
jgi:hypothetical protein